MRSIATCYNEHAIRVSDSYCSGPSTGQSYPNPILSPSAPTEITSIYRAELSPSQSRLLITLTWRQSFLGQGLIIDVADQTCPSSEPAASPRRIRKTKGTKQLQCCNLKIDVFWDLSSARFDNGPEPASGFYVIVMAESEVVLILGDRENQELESLEAKKVKPGISQAKFALVSRSEHFRGGTLYATKARFSDSGKTHDVSIRCNLNEEGGGGPALSVFVDQKRMVEVQRLRWNFRGNQTIFVDGLLVDMMWDVHDWFFCPRLGCGVFMLRRRSGLDSRLWLEEKNLQQSEIDKVEFSLLICAFNNQ